MQRKRQPRFFYAKVLIIWLWFAFYLLLLIAFAEITGAML